MADISNAEQTDRAEVRHASKHAAMRAVVRTLPTDYTDYGGAIERWADPTESYPDCSCGCRWAVPLKGMLGMDWVVCSKQGAPRAGLLTFEHQTGSVCYEQR